MEYEDTMDTLPAEQADKSVVMCDTEIEISSPRRGYTTDKAKKMRKSQGNGRKKVVYVTNHN